MLQKSFSEGIYLEKEGPKSSTIFKSLCNVDAEKSYISGVYLVPKLVPKRTYYTMDGVLEKMSSTVYNRACSLSNGEKSFESSISVDQNPMLETTRNDLHDVPYYQCIELIPGLVTKEYSETIHTFPKENSHQYRTSVTYDPCYTKRNYSVGLEVQKVREVILTAMDDESSFTSSMHVSVPKDNDYCPMNGECDSGDLEARI